MKIENIKHNLISISLVGDKFEKKDMDDLLIITDKLSHNYPLINILILLGESEEIDIKTMLEVMHKAFEDRKIIGKLAIINNKKSSFNLLDIVFLSIPHRHYTIDQLEGAYSWLQE